jgi:hypothetical protein
VAAVIHTSPTGGICQWPPSSAPKRPLRLRATLASIAPGTALRDGLERILRGRTGALIVLGYDKVRRVDLDRRLRARRRVHRHRPARAGQDGRRDHRRRDLTRILRAAST